MVIEFGVHRRGSGRREKWEILLKPKELEESTGQVNVCREAGGWVYGNNPGESNV